MLRLLASTLVLIAVLTSAALAQETRAEALERERAERAKATAPYEPGAIERGLLFVDEHRVLERLAGGLYGFYPSVGGFPTGSGLGAGVGYRKSVLEHQWAFDAGTAASIRGYKVVRAATALPRLFDGRGGLGVVWHWRDSPQEDFFGLGADSTLADRTNYRLRGHEVEGYVTFRPWRWLSAGSRFGILYADITPGTDTTLPAIGDRFTDETAPGLARAPRLGFHQVFLDVDYRNQPGHARAGGRYWINWGWYDDRRSGAFDFGRTDVELLQIVPIFDMKRQFAVRVRVSHIEAESTGRVPFFLMPSVGGADTLRGFREYRFRDANSVLLNGEYRWEAFSALDFALFVDLADIAPEWDGLSLDGLKASWGVGFRFNTNERVFLRLDIGTGGREGTRFFVKFGPAF